MPLAIVQYEHDILHQEYKNEKKGEWNIVQVKGKVKDRFFPIQILSFHFTI